ncbi:DUF1637 domain-containing protein [Miniphocaeibacter massiliensis]|uniref:DUF1637 domain-containing protein n=1 Tax=Miniphocaeibacter massiliensis TaxID=2041841 RepID=UPI000C1BDADC|nr:DUF1637 domain-containing protein [Miniphocaeibacter massiliensis]
MLGTVKSEIGVIFEKDKYKVVRKSGKAGDTIPKHSHEGEEIVFSVICGKVEVELAGKEKYELNCCDVLNFDGTNSISAKFIEDSEVVITLIKK